METTWKQHTIKIKNKISPVIGILWKFSKFMPSQVLKNIFYCLIYSNLQYLTILWGNAAAIYIKPLQILENRAIKNILGLPLRFHTNELYENQNLNVLTIRGIYRYQLANYVYNCIHNTIFIYLLCKCTFELYKLLTNYVHCSYLKIANKINE